MRRAVHGLLIVLLSLAGAHSVSAVVLEVGPGTAFQMPGQAVAAARSGDTIRIAPGRYVDCAIIRQDRLMIEGTGPEVVLADRSCSGKGILVIAGRDITIRNLTVRGARVADGNGAGIRAEGGNLAVRSVRFIDNENGILTAPNPAVSVRVADSVFIGNGKCRPHCAHSIYAGAIRLLRVEGSRFESTREGHHIKSRALRTEVVDNDIADGPGGSASYLVDIPNGGAVLIERNRLQKGPRSGNPGTAIMIGAEGVQNPTPDILVRDNRFVNGQLRTTVFVNNRTETPARLQGNVLVGSVLSLEGPRTRQ